MYKTGRLSKAVVIDSDPDGRRLLEEILNEQGYEVKRVENIQDVAQLFETEDFSLVVNELEYPESDGMKILDLVRRLESRAKVVLTTHHIGVEVYIKARAWGAFDCISKSLEESALKGVIAAARNK